MARWRADQLPPPSPAVTQAAAALGLGGFVATHHLMHSLAPPPGSPTAERWIIRLLILVVAGCLVGSLMFFSNGNPGVGAGFLVPVVGVLILGIVRGKRVRTAGPQPYELAYRFQHGMVCPTLNNPVAFRWDAITEVYENITHEYRGVQYARTTFQYTLVASNGWQVRFVSADARGPQQSQFVLAPVIHQEVSGRVLATATNQVNSGGHALFGEVSIAQQGITTPTGSMPWWRVSELTTDHGVVKVKVDGHDWWSRHTRDIPNFPIFWHLAPHLHNAARPR